MGIHIHNLSHSYGDTPVLKEICLDVSPGEHIGIMGTSGGGKSTLLKLLSGLYTPQTGNIKVYGENDPLKIRKNTAMVMQSAMLFPASIQDNITCGHEIPEERIRHACEAAQLIQWLDSLPQGLDSPVGERGGKVSGGQAQRIAIARALAKDARVLILDEATSALDQKTEREMLQGLRMFIQNKTVVTVSHRPEILLDCSRVYRLEGGHLS